MITICGVLKFFLFVFISKVNITDTSPYAVPNNLMVNGSLTIGDALSNFGSGTGQ